MSSVKPLTLDSSLITSELRLRVAQPVTWYEYVLSVVLLITSTLMVLLVLLHKGKGGGLSDLFGGGVSSSLGGSSVVERNLDRITIAIGLLWVAAIIALGLLLKR